MYRFGKGFQREIAGKRGFEGIGVLGDENPHREELDACDSWIGNANDPRAGFEDVLWGLLNATEFILRR
jgi:hypothetical protein